MIHRTLPCVCRCSDMIQLVLILFNFFVGAYGILCLPPTRCQVPRHVLVHAHIPRQFRRKAQVVVCSPRLLKKQITSANYNPELFFIVPYFETRDDYRPLFSNKGRTSSLIFISGTVIVPNMGRSSSLILK